MDEGRDERTEQLRQQIKDLRAELDRYRSAAQDTLEQVDWCIGYLTAQKVAGAAAMLRQNRAHIRTDLLGRAEQPLPAATDQAGARGGQADG